MISFLPSLLCVHGGFLVLKPNIEDYRAIVDIILTLPFYEGSGWNRFVPCYICTTHDS